MESKEKGSHKRKAVTKENRHDRSVEISAGHSISFPMSCTINGSFHFSVSFSQLPITPALLTSPVTARRGLNGLYFLCFIHELSCTLVIVYGLYIMLAKQKMPTSQKRKNIYFEMKSA